MEKTVVRNAALSAVLVAGLGLSGLAVSANLATTAEAASSASSVADGTYTGSGKGIGGKFDVTVTVAGGKITAVEVGDNSETQGIGSKAIEQLPAKIVEANGTDGVDAVSGATVTSKAIFSAVEQALGGSSEGTAAASSTKDAKASSKADKSAKADSSKSDAAGALKDGEFTGEAKGMESTIKVTVTVKDGKVSDVKAEGQETQGIGSKALEQLPAKIVEANGTDGVDAVSGATVTSKAIFKAVESALGL